jgi:hypothetical protein
VTVASTYGVLDRLEAVTYPEPGLRIAYPYPVSTAYEYDGTATTPAGQATYRYHGDGLLAGASLPNGLEEARCYDPAGRVTAIVTASGTIGGACPDAAGMVSRFDYGYDANGNRTLQWERRTAPGSASIGEVEETRYGYDALDRLVGVGYPDRTVLYQLDAVGNRVGEPVKPAGGVLALTVAAFTALTPADGLASDLVATFNRADWTGEQTSERRAKGGAEGEEAAHPPGNR